MTPEEAERAMAKNEQWSFPGIDDGWVRTHDAIRLDMKDFSEAVAASVSRGTLQPWMVANILAWWKVFTHNVNHHHDIEERVIFPGLIKLGCTLPPKMSADHKQLLESTEAVTRLLTSLPKDGQCDAKALKALQEAFESLRSLMSEHLKEEEDDGLPLMRKLVTQKQFKPIENKIIAESNPAGLGWFLRPFPDDADRRRWMTEVAGIPGFVQWWIMMPAAKKYRNNVARLILEVKAGDKLPLEPYGWFGL